MSVIKEILTNPNYYNYITKGNPNNYRFKLLLSFPEFGRDYLLNPLGRGRNIFWYKHSRSPSFYCYLVYDKINNKILLNISYREITDLNKVLDILPLDQEIIIKLDILDEMLVGKIPINRLEIFKEHINKDVTLRVENGWSLSMFNELVKGDDNPYLNIHWYPHS